MTRRRETQATTRDRKGLACPSNGQGRLTARRPSARVSPSRARATDQSDTLYPHYAVALSHGVGVVAPGGQLPLTWPRHTGPPRAPTRGGRGGLTAFSIREARGWKFELVADCTSIDPARRDYFFSLAASTPRGQTVERKSVLEPDTGPRAFGSDTLLPYGFFTGVDDSVGITANSSENFQSKFIPSLASGWILRSSLVLS